MNSRRFWWAGAEAALGLGAVALIWSFAGSPAWTLWLLMGTSAVACASWGIGAVGGGRSWAWQIGLWLPVVAAATSLAQLMPLPPWLLGVLSPRAAELREFALVPLGLDGWRPVSMDPPATARALARALALLGLGFVAVQLGRSEPARRRLLLVVAGCGVSVVLCAYGHLLAGAHELFGVHTFSAPPRLVTPFGNANHLAAFFTLTATVALGLAVEHRSPESTFGWAAAALAMGVATFLTLSRGGIATFALSWLIAGAVLVIRRAGSARSVAPWVAIVSAGTFAGLLAFEQLLARAETVSSLEKLQLSKIELWPTLAAAALAFARSGMGRGAFELAFSPFQERQLETTVTHPENLLLQWSSEVGLPVALLTLAILVWGARSAWRSAGSRPLDTFTLVGVFGLLIHDLFDFALELNGLSALATVAAGLVAGRSSEATRYRHTGKTLAGMAAAAFIATTAAWRGMPAHTEAERQLTQEAGQAARWPQVRALALRLIDRHPADWVLYATMAELGAMRGDPQNALAWVNRWLYLRPGDARAHVAAAEALLRLGRRSQALLEFKTSFELKDHSALGLALTVAAREGDFERLLVTRRGWLTEAHRWLVARKEPTAAARLLEQALSHAPSDEVRVEAQVLKVGVSSESEDWAQALAEFDALPDAEKNKGESALLRSRLLWSLNRRDEAIDALAARLTAEPANARVALQLVTLFEAMGRLAAAREIINRARPFASPPVQYDLLLAEASLCEREERWAKALELLQAASRSDPTRAELHYHMASLYERLGSPRAAIDALRRGRLVDTPDGGRAKDQWLERLLTQERGRPDAVP